MSVSPDLQRLAHKALADGTALLADRHGRDPITLETAALASWSSAEPLLGIHCAPSVHAVAYPAEVVVATDDLFQDHLVGIAVDRSGATAIVHPDEAAPITSPDHGCLTLDQGLRALRLPTSPPDRPIESYVDGTWLDHVLMVALAADLGDPPRWREISRLHPLAGGLTRSPETLRRARATLHGGWESLRCSVARSGRSGQVMSAALARWCDTGAFARRMLAPVPEPEVVLADLTEILRPRDTALLRTAIEPVLRAR